MRRAHKKIIVDLILSFLVGLIMFFAIWGVQKCKGDEEALIISIAVLSGLTSALFVFFFVIWIDEYQSWRKSVDHYVERIMVDNPFALLIRKQLQMHWQLSRIFRELIESYSNAPGGAIVISAGVSEYMRILSRCLEDGQQSYLAILRGGDPPRYRPSWYFNDDDESSTRKQAYLKLARDADLFCKRRIMIFSEELLREDLYEEQSRKDFIDLASGNGMDLFWLPESEVERACAEDPGFNLRWKQYYQYDFAIVDSMVIKHVPANNGALLFVSIADQIKPYQELFDELEKWITKDVSGRLDFKRVTDVGIVDEGGEVCAWDEWLIQ